MSTDPRSTFTTLRRVTLEQAQAEKKRQQIATAHANVWRFAGSIVMLMPVFKILIFEAGIVIGVLCLMLAELILITAATRAKR